MGGIAENHLQPFAQRRQPGPETVGGLVEPDAGVGDPDDAALITTCNVNLDPATLLASNNL